MRAPRAAIDAELMAEDAEGVRVGAGLVAGKRAGGPRGRAAQGTAASRARLPQHSIAAPARSIGTDRSWPVVNQPKAR